MRFTIPADQMKAYAAKAVAGASMMAFGNYVLKTPYEVLVSPKLYAEIIPTQVTGR